MKKLRKVLLSMTIVFTLFSSINTTFAANQNIALNKTATTSSAFPGKQWTADKTVDGIIDDTTTKNSRWSSKRVGTVPSGGNVAEYDSNVEQWLLIDLGQEYTISQVNIFWEGASASKYKLQSSTDGKIFNDILTDGATSAGWKKHNSFSAIKTQYIRVYCVTPKTEKYGYSIFEIEVYQQKLMENSSDVIDLIESIPPRLSADGKKVVLPEVSQEYDVSVFGTDNQQVINKKGEIIQPLVDMDVNLTYEVTKKGHSKDKASSSKDAKISIAGKYNQETGDNAKPNVVPGLREWKGAHGQFTLGSNSRIVCDKNSQKDAAIMIQSYFKTMLERSLEIVVGEPKSGDIYLESGSTTEEVGKEGYYLSIDDYVTIKSPTYKGMIYGGASITQILYQDKGWDNAPKGLARDYPQYEVRAGMIDVGRMYIPLEYLEEMTIYMSWYKMNEAHIHINDYWGASGYSAFRLESKVYPSINAPDGYYTQEEYKQYQKDMEKYGVSIITEIDTPYHSEAFRDIPGVKMLKAGSLDITTDEAFAANQKIIENLFDEYLDGDDPIIQSDKFHVGTDEYDKKYGEQMRKWTDHFIKYVNNKGYESRAWASLGKNGFNGTTPVTNEATLNLWAPYWADVQETYDAGYDIINTYGGWLYIVPAANAGYPDRFDTKKLYEKFEVNDFKSGRNPSGEAIMPVAHPQTKGASFAIWNDMTSFKTGFSWFDIQDRMKDAVSLVAEKTWFGEDEAGQTYEQFRSRIDALQNKSANTNPVRFVETKGEKIIADYDMKTVGKKLTDKTKNHYDAKVINGKSVNGSLTFDGNGYLSLPMESVGYPYTVSMDIKLSEINQKTTLFNGKDGTFYADLNGKIGYERDAYKYTFDYTLLPDKEVNLTLVCNQKDLTLYVNGKKIGNGKLTNETIGGKAQQSSTFVLPVEKVFENTKGSLSSFSIYNVAMTESEIYDMLQFVTRDNMALNKKATVSALEVANKFTADKAVDGIVSAESRVSFAKANEQWLLVDLGKVQSVGGVSINYESAVGKYEIQVSTDGVKFETVYIKNEDKVNGKKTIIENIEFAPVNARYVRYVQKEMWKHTNNQEYSGSIYEFGIHKALKDELLESVKIVEDELDKYDIGIKNGQLDKAYYEVVVDMLNSYKELANSPNFKTEDLENIKTKLFKEVQEVVKHILYVKQDAVDAFNLLKNIDYHQYTVSTYESSRKALVSLEKAITDIKNYEDVNEVLKVIEDVNKSLVKVDNSQLVKLIKIVEELSLDKYKDITQLQKDLKIAKDVYEKPISQIAIDKAYKQLLTTFNHLEEKSPIIDVDPPTPEDKPDLKPGGNPIETGDSQIIIFPTILILVAGLGIVMLKKKKNNE